MARSTVDSLHHLGPISSMGPWVGWIRRGLDAYLSGDHAAAALCYAHAAEIGGTQTFGSWANYQFHLFLYYYYLFPNSIVIAFLG